MVKVFGASALGFFLLSLIICNFSNCVTTELDETKHYDVPIYSELSHLGALSAIHKLREKRQTPTDLRNQYQFVSQSSTDAVGAIPSSHPTSRPQDPSVTIAAAPSKDAVGTERNLTPTTVTSVSDPPLLGVNNRGQQVDPTNLTAIQPAQNDGTKKYSIRFYPNPGVGGGNVQQQEINVNETIGYHDFYKSTIYVSQLETDSIWDSVKNIPHNALLSSSYRRATTVELTFDFPFYGQPIRNVTVATGGFLFTGDYMHAWIAATQYIAPLMANFDTRLGNDSFVRFNDNGTAFTVIWENVSLQEKEEIGKFSFSTTLHKNGDIVFVYYSIPVDATSIKGDEHPVKVGLSDAYSIKKNSNLKKRTLYEYHRLDFTDFITKNSTIIYLKALPTCLDYKDYGSCVSHMTAFDCTWCPSLNRCSTGYDRKRQEWVQEGCEQTEIDVFEALLLDKIK